MSDDASNEYFSDGISEELLNLLAKIPDLHVAARTSSFSFKGQDLEITEIAHRLNVAHVLEGSVRKADNEVRITAQLIRAEDGFHVWSESWDRTLQDIFAIQDEIAAEVTEQLKVTLLGAAPTAEKVDPEAYALFLQARQLGRQGRAEVYERAIALYEQALAIEPEYTAAWVGLGNTYSVQAAGGLRPVDEGNRLAREAAGLGAELVLFHENSLLDYGPRVPQLTEPVPALRALECQAAMAAACLIVALSGLSPSGWRRMTWLPGMPWT